MIKDEALKLGLEALEGFIPYLPLKDGAQCNRYDKAIAAIKEALAQPEQEPVLWMMPDGKTVDKWALQFYGGQVGKPLYTTPPALAQPEQEFVAWEHWEIRVMFLPWQSRKQMIQLVVGMLTLLLLLKHQIMKNFQCGVMLIA